MQYGIVFAKRDLTQNEFGHKAFAFATTDFCLQINIKEFFCCALQRSNATSSSITSAATSSSITSAATSSSITSAATSSSITSAATSSSSTSAATSSSSPTPTHS
eukprot:Em0002g560a